MKKNLVYLLLTALMLTNLPLCAQTISEQVEAQAPKWEEYVPKKYQNPRDFSRGKSIAELSVGIFLTDLLITAPIGVPMIVHSTTKLKNKSYYDKKIKFDEGLLNADKITDPNEKSLYYKELLNKCNMTEQDRAKILKKNK